jgi:hypothetical protein
MADPGRVARGASLLAWLEREGCEHCVRLGETPGAGGVGVFASRDVERGEVLISCPTRTVISAAETRLDLDEGMAAFVGAMDEIRVPRDCAPPGASGGSPEGDPLDDSTRMQLVLLRERHLAETNDEDENANARKRKRDVDVDVRFSGYWSPYVRALPGDELLASLPLSWSESDIHKRLEGTALFAEVQTERAECASLAAALAAHKDARSAFPPDAFGASRIKWARAVFWSRAIALPLAGWGRGDVTKTKRSSGDDGALTPLLDMCNHARLAGTSLQKRGASWRLVATRRFARDEEVRIDYGGKGNGELLRRHGFVIPNNPFDTCAFRVGKQSFLLHRGVREWREFPPGLRDAARRALADSNDGDDDGKPRGESALDELSFLAATARRLADAAATTAAPGDDVAEEDETKNQALFCARFVPDASGFATSTPFLAERACVIYRESQRSLLRDLGDLAAETIEASRRLDDDDER